MSYRALGDVPTVDVNPAFLTPPAPTSVTDLQLDPLARLGLGPSRIDTTGGAAPGARGLSLSTVLTVGAGIVAYTLIRGRR